MTAEWSPDPSNPEVALAGAMLLDADHVIPMCMVHKGITPDMFNEPKINALVKTLWYMTTKNLCIDAATVVDKMCDGGWITLPSEAYEITEKLIALTPTAANASYYADRVFENHLKLACRRKCQAVIAQIDAGVENPREFVTGVPAQFMDIAMGGRTVRSNLDVCNTIIDRWEKIHKKEVAACDIQTGIPEVDAMLILKPGLHFFCARPSCGKTSLEGQIRTFNAAAGNPVATITMDMDHEDLLSRDLCRNSGVSVAKLNAGYAGEFQRAKLEVSRDALASWPMFVMDEESLGSNLLAIITYINMAVIRHGVKAVTIDYIQQIEFEADRNRDEYRMLNAISKALKRTGKRLRIPIIVLCQLGRSAENNAEKRPRLSDLKGTGNFEQDADSISFLYKEPLFNYNHPAVTYAKIEEAKQRAVVWEVAKQKNGPTGFFPFWFHCHYFKFEIAPADWGFPGMFAEAEAARQAAPAKRRST